MAGAAVQDSALIVVIAVRRVSGRVVGEVAGLRHFLIDQVGDAVGDAPGVVVLFHIQVVVPVEKGVHAVCEQQILDRQRPARAVSGEAPRAVGVVTAPFEIFRELQSAASLRVETPADQVVGENEFEFRRAVFERRLQPAILVRSERPRPRVFRFADALIAVPEWIEHHEQGVPPLEGVVSVARGLLIRIGVGRPRIEAVSERTRIIPLPRGGAPHRRIVVRGAAAQPPAQFRVVVAVHEEQRHGGPADVEKLASHGGARFEDTRLRHGVGIGGRILLAHERVAEIDEEIRMVGNHVREGLLPDGRHRAGVVVVVWVGLDIKGEGAAAGALRDEGALGSSAERRDARR